MHENWGRCVVNLGSENVESKNMKCFTTCMIPVLPGTSGKDLMMFASRLKHVGM